MAWRYIYLIRHGQYDPLEPSMVGGELSTIGKRQARRTAKALKALPILTIYTSSLFRAVQTAEPILAAFPEARYQRTRRLHECIPYVPRQQDDDIHAMPLDILRLHQEQAEEAFDTYFKAARNGDKHEVLVSHANLIRYLVCRALNVDPAAWLNMYCMNCSITRIVISSEGRVHLLSYNDIGHLPLALRTDNMENTFFPTPDGGTAK